MFILKGVKVLCFDTLLQVFILKILAARSEHGNTQGFGRSKRGNRDTVSRTLGYTLPHRLLFVKCLWIEWVVGNSHNGNENEAKAPAAKRVPPAGNVPSVPDESRRYGARSRISPFKWWAQLQIKISLSRPLIARKLEVLARARRHSCLRDSTSARLK